jgi:hypothetical protein
MSASKGSKGMVMAIRGKGRTRDPFLEGAQSCVLFDFPLPCHYVTAEIEVTATKGQTESNLWFFGRQSAALL